MEYCTINLMDSFPNKTSKIPKHFDFEVKTDNFKLEKNPEHLFRVLKKNLATTYSRTTYRSTTIGNAAFDGRVRNGIGSSHCFMATKKFVREQVL